MLFDWFTFAAQLANFLILVWLLKRFLYKPTLHAIDEREQRIAARIKEAEATQATAQSERDALQRANDDLAQQRETLLAKARDEAQAERQRLLEQARQEVDTLRANWLQALQAEQENVSRELASRARTEVFATVRRALTDLADVALEDRLAARFVALLRALDEPAKAVLVAAVRDSSQPAVVRSAFELPPGPRAAIEQAFHETLATGAAVQFEIVPAVIAGIELTAGGHKVAWSITDYLTGLERVVAEIVEQARGPHAEPAKAPTPAPP